MFAKAVFLFLLSIIPRDEPLTDIVDTIEINHLYDSNGKETFTQAIFWLWTPCGMEVVAWRLVKEKFSRPRIDRRRNCWRMQWNDNGKWRRVEAHRRIETHTNYDPEIEARKKLPPAQRRGLLGEGKTGGPRLAFPPPMPSDH